MKKLIFFISLSLLTLVGCSVKKDGNFTRVKINRKHTVWINQDVECCGVKDPANNLEWFKKTTDKLVSQNYSYRTFLFRDKDTINDYIVVLHRSLYHYNTTIYRCNGMVVASGSYSSRERFMDGGAFNSFRRQLEQVNNNKAKTKIKKSNTYTTKKYHPRPCLMCEDFYQIKTHVLIDTISYFNKP